MTRCRRHSEGGHTGVEVALWGVVALGVLGGGIFAVNYLNHRNSDPTQSSAQQPYVKAVTTQHAEAYIEALSTQQAAGPSASNVRGVAAPTLSDQQPPTVTPRAPANTPGEPSSATATPVPAQSPPAPPPLPSPTAPIPGEEVYLQQLSDAESIVITLRDDGEVWWLRYGGACNTLRANTRIEIISPDGQFAGAGSTITFGGESCPIIEARELGGPGSSYEVVQVEQVKVLDVIVARRDGTLWDLQYDMTQCSFLSNDQYVAVVSPGLFASIDSLIVMPEGEACAVINSSQVSQ